MSISKTTILLTGGTGHLGRALLAQLLPFGVKVILVIRDRGRFNADIVLASYLLKYPNQLKFVTFDWIYRNTLNSRHNLRSSRGLERLLLNIDFVVHAATEYGAYSPSEEVLKINLELPLLLLMATRRFSSAKFINIDTYYSLFHTYDHLPSYGLTKRFIADWGILESGELSVDSPVFYNLRLFHSYGEAFQPGRFISNLIRDALGGLDMEITSGRQKRDFIFVDDAVAIIIQVLKDLKLNGSLPIRSIDIGTGRLTSVHAVATLIHRVANSKSVLRVGSLPTRKSEPIAVAAKGFYVDAFRSRCIPLEEGISRAVAVARHNLAKEILWKV